MSDAVPLLLAAGALASKHPWSKTPLGGVLFMHRLLLKSMALDGADETLRGRISIALAMLFPCCLPQGP